MKRLLVFILCAVLVPAAALAQYGVVDVQIYHDHHSGATASQFMLELGASAMWLGDNWNFLAIGSSVSGVSLAYGGCMSAPTYLGSVQIFVTTPENMCTDLRIVPDPAAPSGQIEYVDCSGVTWYPSGYAFLRDFDPCRVNPPENLEPADGAMGVDLSPTLYWTWEGNTNCPEGLGLTFHYVYLGAAGENLELVGSPYGPPPNFELTVGPLSPLTLYQWQVKTIDEFWLCPGFHDRWSPVQSFTTRATIPVEQTTWGHIKSLYR